MSRHKNSTSRRIKHPREESSYRNMMSRCYNPKATGYSWYGGRGIHVSEEWQASFETFLEDMGPREEGKSLDRLDSNGPYSKENCRWATSKEQGNNTSKNVLVEYEGITKNLTQWGEELGILQNTIYYRLARGWSVAEAFEKVPRIAPWQRKLTLEQVIYAVREVAKGRTQIDVGKEVNLHSSQISRLCKLYNQDF